MRASNADQDEDKRGAGEDFNPKQYEGLLPKELLNLPTTVRGFVRCFARFSALFVRVAGARP